MPINTDYTTLYLDGNITAFDHKYHNDLIKNGINYSIKNSPTLFRDIEDFSCDNGIKRADHGQLSIHNTEQNGKGGAIHVIPENRIDTLTFIFGVEKKTIEENARLKNLSKDIEYLEAALMKFLEVNEPNEEYDSDFARIFGTGSNDKKINSILKKYGLE